MAQCAEDIAGKALLFIRKCVGEMVKYENLTPQESIDHQISAIHATQEALQKSFVTEACRLRRNRNALAPISRLPNELLIHTFASAFPAVTNYSAYNEYPRQLAAVSRVSSAWYDLVRNTASLWTRIRSRDHPAFVQAAIMRSKRHPLHVFCPDRNTPPHPEVKLELCGEIPRWQTADIWALRASELDVLTYSGAPILKSLTLYVATNDQRLDLFGGLAPALEHLQLTRVSINWDSPMLAGLRSINLSQIEGPTRLQFLNVLRLCPHLVEITLFHGHLPNADPECLPRSPVELLHLQTLRLHFCPDAIISCFLENISCPTTQTVELFLSDTNQSPENYISLLEPYLQRCSSVGNRMAIQVTNDNIYVLTFYADPSEDVIAKISLGYGVTNQCMEHLRRHFAYPSISAVISSLTATSLPVALAPCSEATSITITNSTHHTIRFLATPAITDGVARWFMPGLKEIVLGSGAFTEPTEVVKMVRGRMGRDVLPRVATELPRPLECLVLGKGSSMDRVTYLTLRAMLGEGRVEWRGE